MLDLSNVRRLLKKEEVRSISRRYFISNGFDGTLTSIGIAVGALLSGVPDGLTVFKIGIGAAVGLGTSGVWSVWEIERAEKRAEIAKLEDAMLTDLQESTLVTRKRAARTINALASGIGPLIGIIVPILPYLLEGIVFTMTTATITAVGLGVGILFVFGAYMGSIANLDWRVAGIRMGLAGFVVAGINIMLPG